MQCNTPGVANTSLSMGQGRPAPACPAPACASRLSATLAIRAAETQRGPYEACALSCCLYRALANVPPPILHLPTQMPVHHSEFPAVASTGTISVACRRRWSRSKRVLAAKGAPQQASRPSPLHLQHPERLWRSSHCPPKASESLTKRNSASAVFGSWHCGHLEQWIRRWEDQAEARQATTFLQP